MPMLSIKHILIFIKTSNKTLWNKIRFCGFTDSVLLWGLQSSLTPLCHCLIWSALPLNWVFLGLSDRVNIWTGYHCGSWLSDALLPPWLPPRCCWPLCRLVSNSAVLLFTSATCLLWHPQLLSWPPPTPEVSLRTTDTPCVVPAYWLMRFSAVWCALMCMLCHVALFSHRWWFEMTVVGFVVCLNQPMSCVMKTPMAKDEKMDGVTTDLRI